jgi:hypothetical protein
VGTVAYELINAPVADNSEDWNKLVAKAVAVIRAKEPKRVIVIASPALDRLTRWELVGIMVANRPQSRTALAR